MKMQPAYRVALRLFTVGVLGLSSSSPARGETIGSPLQQRAFKDGDAGQVYVYDGTSSPFAGAGVASTWSFYDANTNGGIVTPLLFRRVSSSRFELAGIGTSRTSTASGPQSFSFDLIAGSDAVTADDYTFGFTNRAYTVNGSGTLNAGTSTAGVVSYDHPGAGVPSDNWLWTANLTTGGPVSLAIGSAFGTGGTAFHNSPAGARVYSAQFTTVPEPLSTTALAAAANALALGRRRSRASTTH